jgi:EAL domain-containing protein (putative c-di-GMP-specific phosphodiesterase class I)
MALDDTRLDPGFLELELTESSLMQQVEASALALRALKRVGVQLAIDDFGTGYSSLSYLRQFPIDALKVDQSFIHEITGDPTDTSVVRAVIGMGRSLGHRVIAKGVETREQLAYLRAQQCSEGQGPLLSRPLVNEEFVKLLGNRRIRRPSVVIFADSGPQSWRCALRKRCPTTSHKVAATAIACFRAGTA